MSQFRADVAEELDSARRKHPKRFNSAHEGLAILWEEFEELKTEVFMQKADPNRMHAELVQIGAMAQRMSEDLKLQRETI